MEAEYKSVSVPRSLADKVDKLAEARYRGYRSRGEIATDLLRRFVEEAEAKGAA